MLLKQGINKDISDTTKWYNHLIIVHVTDHSNLLYATTHFNAARSVEIKIAQKTSDQQDTIDYIYSSFK